MAYGEKFWYEFDDIHPNTKATWRVGMLWKDYTGSSTELLATASVPLKFTRGDRENDKFVPIIGSEAVLGILMQNESVIKPADFITEEEDDIQIEVKKNGVLYWRGFVKQDNLQYRYTTTPYELFITATDRLALLKANLLDIEAERQGDGYVSIFDLIFTKGVSLCGLDAGFKLYSSLMRTKAPGDLFDSSLFYTKLYARFEAFIGDDGNPINVYDSLKQLAASFGARIFYSGGNFWLQRIEDLQSPILRVYSYDSAGESIGNSLFSPRVILKGEISSANAIYSGNNALIQIISANKQEKSDLDYRFRGFLLNHDWSAFTEGSGFDDWVESKPSLISQGGSGTIDDPYYCIFMGDSDTEYIYQIVPKTFDKPLTIKCKIDMSNCEKTAWQLHTYLDTTVITSPHHVYVNGQWSDASLLSPGNHVYHNFIDKPDDNTGIYQLNVTIPPPPPTSHPTAPFFEWDNQILLMFIDPDGGVPEMKIYDVQFSFGSNSGVGEIDTVRSDKNYSTLHDVDNVFFIDGTDNIANALRYKDDDGNYRVFNFGGKWKSNYGEANQVQKHNLFARIHQNKVPFKLLTTTAFSNELNFENVVQQAYGDYDNYIIMYDDYDVKRCSHELYLLQIVDTLDKFNDNTYLWKQVFKNGVDTSPIRTA